MNLKQSRTTSLSESALNTAIGFGISLVAQWICLPLLGVAITISQNLAFAGIMTVVSVVRGYLVRRGFERFRVSFHLSPFLLAVIAECQRQVDVEGYNAAHDDKHMAGELAAAGAAYLFAGSIVERAARNGLVECKGFENPGLIIQALWPWDWDFWKPKPDDRRRDLVRGCSLGLKEGERMERARLRRDRARPFFGGYQPTAALSQDNPPAGGGSGRPSC